MFRGFGKYKVVYRHLWTTFGASWQVRVSFLLQVAARICRLILWPIAVSLIITHLSVHDFVGAERGVVLFVIISLGLGILTPLVTYIGMLGEEKIYDRLTGQYFTRLVTTDIGYFNSNMTGYLTTATRQYVDGCLNLVRSMRGTYLPTVLSIIFPLAVVTWLDRWLGAAALSVTLLLTCYLFWASSAINPIRARARELYKRNSGRMSDIIANILAVRSSAQEETYINEVKRDARTEGAIFRQRFTMQTKLIGVRELLSVVFFMVLLLLTVMRMQRGAIDLTAAILVVTYTTTILAGIYSLSENLDEHDDLVDKIIPAFDILARENKVQDPHAPVALRHADGDIELRNVSFAYLEQNGSVPVFRGLSLRIPYGQKIGVVGLSGAGKSTLTKLILRFDDVDAGEILIDGVDIRKVRQADLRKQIAYVPQEPLLFHASIRQNVLLARPNASGKELWRALTAAHAAQFVRQLPSGIDSIVGERGVKLSGGQKQRVAIARAVLQNAPIIILDEATSALDSESEQIIKNSFAEILKDKTAIVVAHRLSTLSQMDRIIVVDDGRIIEDGTHRSLLAASGTYARLWKRQQQGNDDAIEVAEPAVIQPDAAAAL